MKELVGNDDSVLLADTVIQERCGHQTVHHQHLILHQNRIRTWFIYKLSGKCANEQCFLVIVDGIVQDRDTWSISSTTLTLGGSGSSDNQSELI